MEIIQPKNKKSDLPGSTFVINIYILYKLYKPKLNQQIKQYPDEKYSKIRKYNIFPDEKFVWGIEEKLEGRRGGGGKEETVTVGLSYKPALTMENTRNPSL